MKFNKNIYLLTLGLASLLPLSCKDFLNETDTRRISEESLFKKPADGINLVNAIYDTFHDGDFMNKSLWYGANFLSQDFHNYGADSFFETYEIPSTFQPLNIAWRRSYQGIARANSAIPIIAKMKEDGVLSQELANRLTGEAYFLRGVFYYYLASSFGGVPLELQTVTDEGRHPRNTQDEVFASVAADMQTAADLLPWKEELSNDDLGRATKGAAIAYKGSALMWIKKYDEAVATFNLLDGRYQLMENFIDIHEFDKQNNQESIFEVQFLAGADQSWGHANETIWFTSFHMPEEASNFGYSYADQKLYNSFEPGDKRKAATVIGPGDEHASPAIEIKNYPKVKAQFKGINTLGTLNPNNPRDKSGWWRGSDTLRSGYYSVKTWRDPNVTGSTSEPGGKEYIFNGQNVIMMRLGEVLLSKAEALAKSGNEAAARDIVNNIIRKRAGLGPVDPSLSFNDVIINEYRHELTGEMSLWYLLRRNGEHINYVKKEFGITIPTGKDLLPIPQEAILNNSTIVQNPGYL
ncbi:RagB/SusD family nutrient uptake outer membrane protein [Adhaeribacter swui]|uniref:RagB/SusD family nutrient uptake outer membrane protein n=1 Tax=Adhaeribacter swui TaxID=2086471 RepID=A0A7G7G8A6_9BACT|nr:RagB/SusD family nutrient uptake outer membrane protein [Adhaeribacter swui]QNF33390.1 RagB/SusD family nutrient uptake outer membrane protein [Adhaeribacter swui]